MFWSAAVHGRRHVTTATDCYSFILATKHESVRGNTALSRARLSRWSVLHFGCLKYNPLRGSRYGDGCFLGNPGHRCHGILVSTVTSQKARKRGFSSEELFFPQVSPETDTCVGETQSITLTRSGVRWRVDTRTPWTERAPDAARRGDSLARRGIPAVWGACCLSWVALLRTLSRGCCSPTDEPGESRTPPGHGLVCSGPVYLQPRAKRPVYPLQICTRSQ